MRTICIIQARLQSSRLPGKVILPLADKPVLAHVIDRCKQIEGVDQVIVAIPSCAEEDRLEQVIGELGVRCHRGPLNDVLARYFGAAQLHESDHVMRVTADCPLLDPSICGNLLKLLIDNEADYGATAGWPHGLDCEVFTRHLLEKAYRLATAAPDREHVTLWMKRQKNIRSVSFSPNSGNHFAQNRWVIDYPEDYRFLQSLFALLPPSEAVLPWRRVLELVEQNPALRAINQVRIAEWGKKNEQIYKSVGHSWKNPT